MNKFLNKKKAPEPISVNADAYNALSSPSSTSPALKKSATSRWKKNKKPLPAPKPEPLNISAALPTSDDFRTSLLMPNLSARFSMLREQDDPKSLLGKASDDSVLQPRRRSRMGEFGFGPSGLNDIEEVQSINSSIRPPFANSRQDSFGSEDGYGSENDSHHGSVLGRARPGEGNNLFGGRQKIYKIAMGGASASKLGKAVYEDDVGMSAFQRYRKEREAAENWQTEDDPSFDFGLDQTDSGYQDDPQGSALNDSAKDLSHSPTLSSYEKKRSTASSTARSEARSSTAATSVASQPVGNAPSPLVIASQQPLARENSTGMKRSDTQKRRLYEQGLDQHMHDQQASALTRLNSIQRQRGPALQSPPFLYSAKSAGNLSEAKPQPVYALQTQGPPPVSPLPSLGINRKPGSGNASPLASGPQSPVSPQTMDFPDLTQALEPGDRGKATAMGAFNKPKQQFDEAQYLERQQQLQRSQSKSNVRKDSTSQTSQSAVQQRLARFEQAERERSASNASVHQRIGRIEQVDRARSGSNASGRSARSRSRSAPRGHEPAKAYNVFQNAANNLPTKPGSQQYDTHRTFFGNISASDSEEEDDDEMRNQHGYGPSTFGYGGQSNRWQPAGLPSVSEHPALRGHGSEPSLAEEDEEDLEPKPLRPTPSSHSLRTDARDAEPGAAHIDSPTLGPITAEPLSGMVSHLRQKSNQSSIYPDDSAAEEVPKVPEVPWTAKNGTQTTLDSVSRVESTYTHSNPWDLDDLDTAYIVSNDAWEGSPISPAEGARSTSQFGSPVLSRQNIMQDRHSEASRDSGSVSGTPWQQELRKQHTRDASTATQQERDAFANELAARRNAIQENMKSIVEGQSRAASPVPSASGGFKAFGMLRSKSSRESIDISKREPSAPTKAMKMLGLGANASSVTLNSQYERNGYSFDAARPRNNSGSRPPPLPTSQTKGPLNDWEQARARGDSDASKYNARSPASSASKARSRSNSEVTTGRSRSRTGPYRDDLQRAMAEGMGSSAAGHPELSPMIPRELTPRPSPEAIQNQFDTQSRARSNSRPGYFESKSMQPIQTGRLAPNGLTPVTLSPNVYSPATPSSRPSPPMAQNPTPPLSGANTPQGATFTPPQMPVIQPRQGLLRKKTVAKNSISEPTLISSTSNVDTIDLPEGASLKNGMDDPPPPPLPPINPRRRATRKIFGLGRSETSEDASNYSNFGRSKTPDPWMNRSTTEPDFDATRAPRGFEGRPGVRPSFENHSSPAIQQYANGPSSPERIERSPLPQSHATFEGGMF